MPDFCTHHIFGEIALGDMDSGAEICRRFSPVFFWGCQGPDLLFSHRALRGGSPLPALGNRMHEEKTGEIFSTALEYCERLSGMDLDRVRAYIMGLVCHYALDSTVHPYVYYWQGRRQEEDPKRDPDQYHYQIETDMDMDLHVWYYGLPCTCFEPAKYYRVGDTDGRSIGRFYCNIIKTVFGEETAIGDYTDALSSSLGIHTLTYRAGRLGRAVTGSGLLGKKAEGYKALFKGRSPKWDVLNLSHGVWNDPAYPDVPRTDSVPDMIIKAQARASGLFSCCMRRFSDPAAPLPALTVDFEGRPLPKAQ